MINLQKQTTNIYTTLQKGVKPTKSYGNAGNQEIVDQYYNQIKGKNEVYNEYHVVTCYGRVWEKELAPCKFLSHIIYK